MTSQVNFLNKNLLNYNEGFTINLSQFSWEFDVSQR